MAKLLIKENKPKRAVEILIVGVIEAKRWSKTGVPKALMTDLKKALKVAGIGDPVFTEQVVGAALEKGEEFAFSMVIDRLNKPK